jgi:acyl-CoA thioesterase-1
MRHAGLVLLIASACAKPASVPEHWQGPAVVFLGDSLTAGQGVERQESYPALLESRMRAEGLSFPVVNAGISGDATDQALARLDPILRQPVAVLFVALGVNDAIRFHRPPPEIRSNLARIIDQSQRAGARVVLAGMKLPLKFSAEYREEFEEIYPSLAHDYRLPLVPFLLEGVGGNPALNQGDGLHPTAAGYQRVAALIWPVLQPVLRAAVR